MSLRNRTIAGLAAFGIATALAAVPTTAATSAPAAAPSAQDAAYLEFAARANLAEIAQGKLAKKHARSSDVRDFGRDMVKDHKAQLASLEATAAALGVTLPNRPTREQRKITRAWAKLDARAFDCAYVPFQFGDHQLVIAMTEKEVAQGAEPTVKSAASASLPVLQEHYEHVTMLVHDLRC